MRLARTAKVLAATAATAATAAILAIAAVGIAGRTPMAAAAENGVQQDRPTLSLSPSSGTPGSGFLITFRNFDGGPRCILVFLWDGQKLAVREPAVNGSVAATVPAAAPPGPHLVSAYNSCNSRASAGFWVVAGPIVTKPPPITTAPSPTTVPPRPSTTTTTVATTTATTTAPTSTAPPTTASAPTTTPAGAGTLIFDRPSIQAGEPLTASGTGCDPGMAVTLTAAGERIGGTVADAAGRFSAPVDFTRVEPGRQVVTATCGAVLTASVDIVLTSSTSGNTGALVVLVLVLLAAAALLARTAGGVLR